MECLAKKAGIIHPMNKFIGFLIQEKVNGKILTGAVIHHINNDKSDNRLDNLQLIEDNGKHRRENHSGVPVDYMPAFTDREMEFVREHLPLDVILKQKRPG